MGEDGTNPHTRRRRHRSSRPIYRHRRTTTTSSLHTLLRVASPHTITCSRRSNKVRIRGSWAREVTEGEVVQGGFKFRELLGKLLVRSLGVLEGLRKKGRKN